MRVGAPQREECMWTNEQLTNHLFHFDLFFFFLNLFSLIFFTLQLELLKNKNKNKNNNNNKSNKKTHWKTIQTNKQTSGRSRSAPTCCCCCPMYRGGVSHVRVPRRSPLCEDPFFFPVPRLQKRKKKTQQPGNGVITGVHSQPSPFRHLPSSNRALCHPSSPRARSFSPCPQCPEERRPRGSKRGSSPTALGPRYRFSQIGNELSK